MKLLGYHVETEGQGEPLLLIHGFTGSGSDLPGPPGRRVIRVDLLGHGESDAPKPARHAVERQAGDLAAILRQLNVAVADVVGYSVGARIALQMAATRPEIVGRLVLESPSAGIADPVARAARRASDEDLARLLERDGIEAFVVRWESLPVFVADSVMSPQARADLHAARLRNRPAALAASLRGAGQGSMQPLFDRLPSIRARTLVVAGALEPIGLERARTIAAAIPKARLKVIAGAGHAPHRENPQQFLSAVADFLASERVKP